MSAFKTPEKQAIEKQTFKEVNKEKEFAKEHKDNKDSPDKLKHEKEQKDQQKDKPEKEKPEKEKNEKAEKHEKTEKHEKNEKHEKHEKENLKLEQLEIHPFQSADAAAAEQSAATPDLFKLQDKIHIEKYVPEKFYKNEKHEYFEKFRKNEKLEYEYQVPVVIDPGGPVEQRLAALEATMAQLQHFIPQDLRPDLSKGALKQEPAAPVPAHSKPEEEKKK